MTNSSKVRDSRFRDRQSNAGAIQSAMTQKLLGVNLKQRISLLTQALFSTTRGRFTSATLDDLIASLKPDLTGSAAQSLGLTSSRVTLHFFRYKVTPSMLSIVDGVITGRGFRRIGGIMGVISVFQFPDSKLCLAIEADKTKKNIFIDLAAVGLMGKKPADFAAATGFLNRQPGETRFGDLFAHKHLATFAQLPEVALELIDTPLQAIWEAVRESTKS